jgi:Interferon-induced transmembrane protein/zinc-ribbon domain
VNCPYCGTSNLDNATICANCGRPLTGAGSTPPPPPSQQASYTPPTPTGYGSPSSGPGTGAPPASAQVPNYLIQSILVTLCCCLPLGIVAIIFAVQVNSKLQAGDVAGAMESSRQAKMWCWIAFGLGVVANLIIWGLWGAAVLEAIRQGQFSS